MDCVSCVVTDVLQGFGQSEGTLALALDLKGAFNAVLPGVLVRQLIELGVPGRIVNFVNSLTTRRTFYFSSADVLLEFAEWVFLRGVSSIHFCLIFTSGGLMMFFRRMSGLQCSLTTCCCT